MGIEHPAPSEKMGWGAWKEGWNAEEQSLESEVLQCCLLPIDPVEGPLYASTQVQGPLPFVFVLLHCFDSCHFPATSTLSEKGLLFL